MQAIDHRALEAIRDLEAPGNEDVLARVLRMFFDESRKHEMLLVRAVDSGDAEALRSSAHFVRSSADNVGAARVAELSLALEVAGRREELSGASTLLCQLVVELDRAREELRQVVESETAR